MQPAVQQTRILPVDAQRCSNQDRHEYGAQTRQVYVQRDFGKWTFGQGNPADIPETVDREKQEPAQYRLRFRKVVSEYFDKMRHRRVFVILRRRNIVLIMVQSFCGNGVKILAKQRILKNDNWFNVHIIFCYMVS